MKISTDAVLLGAWIDTTGCKSILDIGAGSGILALMLAQRTSVFIDAVEIDALAAKTAQSNFYNSKWKSRLLIYNLSLNEFLKLNCKTYDLIVCNPPFFNNSLLSDDAGKNLAKHNVSLTYKELVNAASLLLNHEGRLCVILPFIEQKSFSDICLLHNLKCARITEIIPVENKKPNRVLMEWIKTEDLKRCLKNTLTIRRDNNTYTTDYKELTKEYLLNS